MQLNEIYLSGLSYVTGIPKPIESIKNIDLGKKILLQSLGLKNYCESEQDVFTLAKSVCEKTIVNTKLEKNIIDTILFAIEPSVNASNNWISNEFNKTNKDIKWLLQNLELTNTYPIGLSLFNCATLLSGIKISKSLLASNNSKNILFTIAGCASEVAGLPRLPDDNSVLSDGAGSLLLTNRPTEATDCFKLIDIDLITTNINQFRSKDGNTNFSKYAVEKSNTIKLLVKRVLDRNGYTNSDFSAFIMQNINTPVTSLYLSLTGFTAKQNNNTNIQTIGHVIALDNLVNLKDYVDTSARTNELIFILGTSGIQIGCAILQKV